MIANWKGYLLNTLWVLNILLLFLLLFERYLAVPVWFQPVGRLHPLILHFPIGLLALAIVLEFFRSKWSAEKRPFYEEISDNLWLFASISAGIAAVCGLFLSLESGYEADTLFWHKYAGSAIFFLASIFYLLKEKVLANPLISKVFLSFCGIALIVGGHQGASITHGEGYLLAGLTDKEPEVVPFEQALVFQDLVLPILEAKCVTCHNNKKAKGELIMTSMAELLKGGKSGAIFVAGHPETSTMTQRIFLPMDDKEHMPPSGKTQLSDDEKEVLRLWILKNADDKLKLASLSDDDELAILGRKLLKKPEKEINYEFKSADQELVDKLNATYRIITPLAKGSPALSVSFYGAKDYTSERLSALLELKEQIVSLHLNKIPVSDKDLETIAKFENLRTLNINFSNVTANGLLALPSLKALEKLSISGVQINKNEIEKLLQKQEGLQSITIWNTLASSEEIKALQKQFSSKAIIAGREGLSEMVIQLNEPFIANKSAIFKDSMILQLGHPIQGVDLKIALNKEAIDSLESLTYAPKKIVIKESKALKAKAYKKGWLSSQEVTLNVYQNKYDPDTVLLLTKLNRVHPANGSLTFFDKVLGKNGANNPAWANNWAGFKDNDMVLMLQYDEPVSVSKVSLNLLIESETSIFPPESIEIWGGNDPDNLKLLGRTRPLQPTERLKGYIQLVDCSFKTFTGNYFKVIARPLQSMPSWKSKKGQPALFLVDELFVN